MTLDENDLRAGLRALTAAPPPAPADRAAGSVRRLRTLRRRRTGLAVATAFAVALPLVAVVTRGPGPAPVPSEPLTTALLDWPERYGEGGREFGRLVVRLVDTEQSNALRARLLYAGQVEKFLVAVVARCDATGCGDVEVMYREPGQSLQRFAGARLDATAKDQPIGWYLPAAEGSTLFVLGPPGSRHLRANGVDVTDDEGVFVTGIGYRSSFLDVRVEDSRSRPVVSGRPGLPGVEPRDAVPYTEPLTPPAQVPAGYRAGPVYAGQVGIDPGRMYPAFEQLGDRGTYRVFVRCRGAGREIAVLTHTTVVGRVPCDGELHEGPLDDSGQAGGSFSIEPPAQSYDPFTTYSVAVGYPD